jgi:hypothetical protein
MNSPRSPYLFRLLLCGLALFFLTGSRLQAQAVSLQVNVLPPYAAEFDYYLVNSDNLLLTLQNNWSQSIQLYAGASLKSDRGIHIASQPGLKPATPIELEANEIRLISGSMLEELGLSFRWPDDFNMQGLSQEELDQIILSRTIPEGTYEICIQLYDWDTESLLLESCSNEFEISFAQAPVLTSPEDGTIFDDPNQPLFVQWNPVLAGSEELGEVAYALQILELDPSDLHFGLSYVQTLFETRTNIVYEQEELSGLSELVDFQDFESLDDEKYYVMRVVATDIENGAYIANEGMSNLLTFMVQNLEELNQDPIVLSPERRHYFDHDAETVDIRWYYKVPEGADISYQVWIVDVSEEKMEGKSHEQLVAEFDYTGATLVDQLVYASAALTEQGLTLSKTDAGDFVNQAGWFEAGHHYLLWFRANDFSGTTVFEDGQSTFHAFVDFSFARDPEERQTRIAEPVVLAPEKAAWYRLYNDDPFRIEWEFQAPEASDMSYQVWILDYTEEKAHGQWFNQLVNDFDYTGASLVDKLVYAPSEKVSGHYLAAYKGSADFVSEAGWFEEGHYYLLWFRATDLNDEHLFANGTHTHHQFVDFYYGSPDPLADPVFSVEESIKGASIPMSWSESEAPGADLEYAVFIADYTPEFQAGQSLEEMQSDFEVNGLNKLVYQNSSILDQHELVLIAQEEGFKTGHHYLVHFTALDRNGVYSFQSTQESFCQQFAGFTYGVASGLPDPVVYYPLPQTQFSQKELEVFWSFEKPEDIPVEEMIYNLTIVDITVPLLQGKSRAEAMQDAAEYSPNHSWVVYYESTDATQSKKLITEGDEFFTRGRTWFYENHNYVLCFEAKDLSLQHTFASTGTHSAKVLVDFAYGPGGGLTDPVITAPATQSWLGGHEILFSWDFEPPEDLNLSYDLRIFATSDTAQPANVARSETYLFDRSWQNYLPSLNLSPNDAGFDYGSGWFTDGQYYLAELTVTDLDGDTTFASNGLPYTKQYVGFYYHFANGGSIQITQPTEDFTEHYLDEQVLRFAWEIYPTDPAIKDQVYYQFACLPLDELTGFSEEDIARVPEMSYAELTAKVSNWDELKIEQLDPWKQNYYQLPLDTLDPYRHYLFWVVVNGDSAQMVQAGMQNRVDWRVFTLHGHQANSHFAMTAPVDHFYEAMQEDGTATFSWETELPDPALADSLYYGYAVIKLNESTGFTEAEIAHLPNLRYTEFFTQITHWEVPIEELGPYNETSVEIPLDSLDPGESYLFLTRLFVTARGEEVLVPDQREDFRVFHYEKSGLAREPEFAEQDSLQYASSDGNLTFNWEAVGLPASAGNHEARYTFHLVDLTATAQSLAGYDAAQVRQEYFLNPAIREWGLETYTRTDLPASQTSLSVHSTEVDSAVDAFSGEVYAAGGFIADHQYLAWLEVEDLQGNLRFSKTEGDTSRSEPFVFSYSRGALAEACEADCYYTETISTLPASNPLQFNTLQIGNFTIEDVKYTSGATAAVSGEGVIEVNFLNGLKVEVEFSGVKVNEHGRIFQGAVKAKTESNTAFDLAQVNQSLTDATQIGESTAATAHDYLLNVNNVSGLASGQQVSLPIGLDQSIQGYHFALGFTAMSFEPDQASCNLMVVLDLSTLGEGKHIALGATELCLSAGGFASEYVLNLMADLHIQADGDQLFTLKGSSADAETVKAEATYLAVNCEGIESFAIRGEVALPTAVVLPEDEAGDLISDEKVKAHFALEVDKATAQDSLMDAYGDTYDTGLQWIAAVEIDPFQIKGLKGWGFQVEEAYLDLSDLANPDSMRVPGGELAANVPGMDDTWQGFYLKTGYLRTPKTFMNGRERRSAEIAHLTIDPFISGDIRVTQLISTNEGNLEGWGFSLDTVYLRFEENTFSQAGMQGKISTPVMDSTQYLDYTSILTHNDDYDQEYDFLVKSKDTLNFPLWIAGAQLDSSSYITIHLDEEEVYLESFMKGAMGINLANWPQVGSEDTEKPAFDMNLEGLDFQFQYNSQDGFSDAAFGMASGSRSSSNGSGSLVPDETLYWASTDEFLPPQVAEEEADNKQNKLSGFPFSIEDMGLQMNGKGVSLSISPRFALVGDEEGFAASTTVLFNAELNQNARGLKKFQFTGASIECVSLDVDISNLLLEGELCFYQREENGTVQKGTRGGLNVFVPGVDVGVNLAAEFGTSITDEYAQFGTEDYYPYWFVDGLFYVGSTGIIIPPGYVTLHGMGGGVSFNMAKTDPSASVGADALRATQVVDTAEVTGHMDLDKVAQTEIERVPQFGARSVSFTLIMAILKAELMNMDVGMEIAWQKGQGIQSVSLMGDGYFFTPINDRNDPQLRADKSITWSRIGEGQSAVDANLDLYMNFEVIKGGYPGNKMISGANAHWQNYGGSEGKGYWDVQLGNYQSPGKAKIDWGSDWMTYEAETYLMAGHNVPTALPPLPDKIQDLLNHGSAVLGDNSFEADLSIDPETMQRDEDQMANLATGQGIAQGSEIEVAFNLRAGALAGQFEAVLGYDFLISHDEDRFCYAEDNSRVSPGVKGWYGMGQVYAGLEGVLGIATKLFGEEQIIEIMELGAAIALEGGAPGPTWVEGRGVVSYSVLNGTLEGSQRFPINFGEACEYDQNDDLMSIDFIANFAPEGTGVDPYSDAAVSFHLPMDEVLYLPVTDEEGNKETHQYRPYLHAFTVQKKNGSPLNPSKEMWNEDQTLLQLRFEDPFAPKTGPGNVPEYAMEAVVRAEKWNPGTYTWESFYYDGEIWEERKSAGFKTGAHPQNFGDDELLYSTPLNGQRYYLQDEAALFTAANAASSTLPGSGSSKSGTKGTAPLTRKGGLYFKQNMAAFFPASDRSGNYEYLLRFRTQDQEDQEVSLSHLAGRSSITEIEFAMPELENESLYAVQVVKKHLGRSFDSKQAVQSRIDLQASADSEADTYAHYQLVSQAASTELLSESVGSSESLLYVFYFQTSAYNRLEDKLASASLSHGIANLVFLDADEPFDQYDVLGALNGDGEVLPPRVHIYDPFTSDYHQNTVVPNFLEPYQNYQSHVASNPLVVGQLHYEDLPDMILPGQTGAADELYLDWETDMRYALNYTVMSGYENRLSPGEINRQFSSLSQVFASEEELSGLNIYQQDPLGTSNSSSSSSNLLAFSFDTPFAVEADAEVLQDWALYLLTKEFTVQRATHKHYYHYFLRNYRDMLVWKDELVRRGDLFTDFSHGFSTQGSIPPAGKTTGKQATSSSVSGNRYPLWFVAERAFDLDTPNEGSEATLPVEMD